MERFTWYPHEDNGQNGLMLPPPKKPKKAGGKTWIACLVTGVLTAGLCLLGFCLMVTKTDWLIKQAPPADVKDAVESPVDVGQTQQFFDQLTARADKTELTGPAIYQKVHSSIVSIETQGSAGGFLNRTVTLGSGSGIILSQDGYIVTNNHVIQNATNMTVTLTTGDIYDATLVATDSETDLAVIKIEAANLPAAALGDSDKLLVGDKAYAIGNPLGKNLYSSFTGGFISGLNRTLDTNTDENGKFIQTDTAINPGNSGGALVNSYGEVIGINTSKYSGNDVEGIGFAIPINEAKAVVDELIHKGYVTGRPLLGLNGKSVSDEEKAYYDLSASGVYVTGLTNLGAAQKAGIKVGDIITYFDGQRVKSNEEMDRLKDTHKAGDLVTVTVNRGGKEINLTVKLAEEKPAQTIIPKMDSSDEEKNG